MSATVMMDSECEHKPGDRFSSGMSWLWFSCLALLFLLPPDSFAQAHLWKCRPFRANDTVHSGGDHICDLRRDSDADGKPDRLGDCVTVSGTVIAEPATYETGGWLFWIREGTCGILVYGEQENLRLGDSVESTGWVRLTNGDFFFPETGLATLGDVALENGGIGLRGKGEAYGPVPVVPREFAISPQAYGGNLIMLSGSLQAIDTRYLEGDTLVRLDCKGSPVLVYLDEDTYCSLELGRCYTVTGIVTRIETPEDFASSPAWCLAPRHPGDIVEVDCLSAVHPTSWGSLKRQFRWPISDSSLTIVRPGILSPD